MAGKLPPICQGWREQAKRRSLDRGDKVANLTSYGGWGQGGIDFQDHPSWADGLNVKRVPSGPHKGRVMWTSRREAQEIARMKSDVRHRDVRYDP